MRFKKGTPRNQTVLFPESLADYIGEGHLAKFIQVLLDNIDIETIERKYSPLGQRAYDPRMILSVLIYGYCIGERSSRRLAAACRDRVDFMYLSGRRYPSHKTINEFRGRNSKELKEIFRDIVLIAGEFGIINLGKLKVSLDGTKMRADAATRNSVKEKHIEKQLSLIDERIKEILLEAEEKDREEDALYSERQGNELPEKLTELLERKDFLKEAMERVAEKKEAAKKKILSGKKKNRLSKNERKLVDNIKINLTDPDAGLMKGADGRINAGYNGQALVEEKEQLIIEQDANGAASDKELLRPSIEGAENSYDGLVIDELLADAGYHSKENFGYLSGKGMSYIVDDPFRRKLECEEQHYHTVNFKFDGERDVYICPEGKELVYSRSKKRNGRSRRIYKCNDCPQCPVKADCTKLRHRSPERWSEEELVERNRELLLSPEGREIYRKRMYTVEPVFGNIKHNLGYRRILLRGLDKVKGEFSLMCSAHNIRKLFSILRREGKGLEKLFGMRPGFGR